MDSQVCVNCGNKNAVNATDNRLVTESCGHVKCMQCLLQETSGCVACKNTEKGLQYLNQNGEGCETYQENLKIELERKRARLERTGREEDLEDLTVEEYVMLPVTLEETDENQGEDIGRENNKIVLTVEDYTVLPATAATTAETQAQDNESENKKLKLDTAHIVSAKDGDSRWYLCTLCQRKFSARSQVTYHAYCNGEKKPFECKDCNRSFVTISHYKYHRQSKHPSPTERGEYRCNICDARFIQKSKLERHNLMHTKLKQHPCKDCDKAFNNKVSLRKHELLHSGKQPYSCPHCLRRFRDSSNLKKHVQHKHSTPESQDASDKRANQYVGRKYKCSICTLAFHSRKDLRRHEAIHSGQKPFVCPILDFKCKQPSFRRRDNYNRHLRNTHGIIEPVGAVDNTAHNGQNGATSENEVEKVPDEVRENAKLKVLNPLPPLPEEVIQKHLYTEEKTSEGRTIDNELEPQTIDNACEESAIDIDKLEVHVLDVQVIDEQFLEPVVDKGEGNPVIDKSYIMEANNARESVICKVRERKASSPAPAYVHKLKAAHAPGGRELCLPPIDARKLVELVALYPHEKEQPPRALDMPPLLEKDVQTLKNILHDQRARAPARHWRKQRLAGDAAEPLAPAT